MSDRASNTDDPSDEPDQPDAEQESEPTFYYRVELLTPQPDAVSAALIKLDNIHGTEIRKDSDTESRTRVIFYWEESTPVAGTSIEKRISFYFSARPDLDAEIDTCEIFTDESWKEAWKEYFEPIMVAPSVRVGPTWEEFEGPEDGTKLELNPAMAFGTGTHETTQLSAALLESVMSDEDGPSSVLDVGCGSGILSMIAVRMGADRVLGLDIDEDAVANARQNLEANDLTETVQISTRPVEDIDETFDLVLANILSHILLDIQEPLVDRVREGGHLVLSGIGAEHAEDFVDEFFDDAWDIIEIRRDGDWAGIWARRKTTAT